MVKGMNEMKVCTITGYKSFEIGVFNDKDIKLQLIKVVLKKRLIQLIEEGLEWVLISGQLGTEIWAAQVVIELQDLGFPIQLAVITPFKDPHVNWNEKNQEMMEEIILAADFYESLSNRPYENPNQFRTKDIYFLNKSDGALVFYDEEHDASPKYFLQLAKKYQETNPYEILQIDFYEISSLAEELQENMNSYE